MRRDLGTTSRLGAHPRREVWSRLLRNKCRRTRKQKLVGWGQGSRAHHHPQQKRED
jgi:hypothetical protein